MKKVITLEFTQEELEVLECAERILEEAEKAFAGTDREAEVKKTKMSLYGIRNNEPLE